MPDDATTPQTLEQKIDAAALKASEIVATFSPVAAVAIQGGVAAEPVISGLIHLFIGIFKHHAKNPTSAA